MAEIRSEADFRILEAYTVARNEAVSRAEDEKNKQRLFNRPWGIYESNVDAYSRYFAGVLDEDNLRDVSVEYRLEYLMEQKRKSGSVFILEAMGPGRIYRQVPVDGEVAITLSDLRTIPSKKVDKRNNMRLLAGDILDGKIWERVDYYMEENQSEMNGGFDFIFCRPVGGWGVVFPPVGINGSHNDARFAITSHIVSKLLNRLSPQGILLFAADNRGHVLPLYKELDAKGNYSISIAQNVMKIEKNGEPLVSSL